MLQIISTIAPIFIVIIVGQLLWRAQLFEDSTWTAIGNICYFLLFPCLIIKTLSTANLSALPITKLAIAMPGTILIGSCVLLALKPLFTNLFSINSVSFTSLFQGVTRFHGFMALAIVAGLYGDYAITIIALTIALMVPLINVINVTVLTVWGEHGLRQSNGLYGVITEIIKNPFIIACVIGILLNITGIQLHKILLESISIMSSGALGLSLLAIGAGLRIAQIKETRAAILCAVLLRLIGMPIIMFTFTTVVGLTGKEQTVAVIATAVPTAASSYVLAQKMGGDTVLMANIITLQVIIASLTLPLAILLAETY